MGELRREEGGKTFHQGWWENLGLSMGGWEGLVGGAPPKRVGRGRENSGVSIRRRGSTKESGKRGRHYEAVNEMKASRPMAEQASQRETEEEGRKGGRGQL